MRRILPVISTAALLLLTAACHNQQQDAGTKGNPPTDDEPIIVGDTSTLPYEESRWPPPYRFIYSQTLDSTNPAAPAHKPPSDKHRVGSLFVCSRKGGGSSKYDVVAAFDCSKHQCGGGLQMDGPDAGGAPRSASVFWMAQNVSVNPGNNPQANGKNMVLL